LGRKSEQGEVMTEQLHLGLHPVRSDRAEEFERFLAEVVVPAVRAQRPDLDGRWRVMRSSESSNDVVTYVFMLEGGSLAEDWELGVLLPAHYGQEEAERRFGDWAETFAPLDAWAKAAVTSGRDAHQLVWTLEPVTLT
jgi:hypothetical protein